MRFFDFSFLSTWSIGFNDHNGCLAESTYKHSVYVPLNSYTLIVFHAYHSTVTIHDLGGFYSVSKVLS